MRKNLMNFSSINPIQMFGKKKNFYKYDPLYNHFDTKNYCLVDTNITKALKTEVPNFLAGLTFPTLGGVAGFNLGNFIMQINPSSFTNPTFLLTSTFIMLGIGISIGEIKLNVASRETGPYSDDYFTFPISSSIYNIALNSALYPILLPAKLIAKAKMHSEIKLAETDEGREAIKNKYTLPIEIKNQKTQLKQNKRENAILTKANKQLETQQNLFSKLKKYENENLKLQAQNTELKNKNEQIKNAINNEEEQTK